MRVGLGVNKGAWATAVVLSLASLACSRTLTGSPSDLEGDPAEPAGGGAAGTGSPSASPAGQGGSPSTGDAGSGAAEAGAAAAMPEAGAAANVSTNASPSRPPPNSAPTAGMRAPFDVPPPGGIAGSDAAVGLPYPSPSDCPAHDLESALGRDVLVTQLDPEGPRGLPNECFGRGPVVTARWVAPFSSRFSIDTVGSTFDTVLGIHDDCHHSAWSCDDDTFGLQSRLVVRLEEGQSIVLAVHTYDGHPQPFQLDLHLSITQLREN